MVATVAVIIAATVAAKAELTPRFCLRPSASAILPLLPRLDHLRLHCSVDPSSRIHRRPTGCATLLPWLRCLGSATPAPPPWLQNPISATRSPPQLLRRPVSAGRPSWPLRYSASLALPLWLCLLDSTATALPPRLCHHDCLSTAMPPQLLVPQLSCPRADLPIFPPSLQL